MVFLIAMTNFLLLIGAGLFSRAVWAFQTQAFNKLLGADVDDAGAAGDGPGSYDVRGNVWHLNCCNPENKSDADGWSMFSAIFGWTNSATLGSILAYVFYWLAAIACLIYLKFTEVRSALCTVSNNVPSLIFCRDARSFLDVSLPRVPVAGSALPSTAATPRLPPTRRPEQNHLLPLRPTILTHASFTLSLRVEKRCDVFRRYSDDLHALLLLLLLRLRFICAFKMYSW